MEIISVLLVLHDALLAWLAHGLLATTWGWALLFTLLTTHLTIVAVTIYLHRSQAHLALKLHPVLAHVFRFWLWFTTGMNTKEWVSVHRKHHAKCEAPGDPHSPQIFGLKKVLLTGAELYKAEAKVEETIARYGHGTPDDWVERNLYRRFPWQGVGLLLIVDLFLFGSFGAAVWALQMAWIPVTAAGVINGLGHAKGYRNFKPSDQSTNLIPWGILIGGEELHNNHHTYPTSAKLSVRPWEFDIGWLYICLFELLGLAKVRRERLPPTLSISAEPHSIEETVKEVIRLRYELLAMLDQITDPVYAQSKKELRDSLEQLWTDKGLATEEAQVKHLMIWQHTARELGLPFLVLANNLRLYRG